ncbi:MAG: GTPase Era [Hyphomicrobiaceae bacterium]
MTDQPDSTQRCGFIAVIGAPNAGKSTLVNRIVGAKVSIVSHKVQTTRMQIRGIAIHDQSQLVFIDTPGIFEPKRRLDRAMVKAAWTGAGEGDIVALVVDAARGLDEDVERILERLGQARSKRLLILNKIDRLEDKEQLLALTQLITKKQGFDKIFMIAALGGDGVDDLKKFLADNVPAGPWHYPADEISDLPVRMLAAEITREKIFHRLHDELPYAITVETLSWKKLRNGGVRVEQTIFVERESQRKIVLGKAGATIKQISMEARKELSHLIEQKVDLFLFVKIRENWGNDPERYREIGLEFPKD